MMGTGVGKTNLVENAVKRCQGSEGKMAQLVSPSVAIDYLLEQRPGILTLLLHILLLVSLETCCY